MDNKEFSDFSRVLENILKPDFIKCSLILDQLTVYTYPATIIRVLSILSNHPLTEFHMLIDLTAIDYPQSNPRFEIAYQLLSLTHNKRICLKTNLADGISIPTATPLFPNANWYEREVWDMFGILFIDHPDMRRILTDYGFSGHPLRKDFPLSGFTQVRYCQEQNRVITEPTILQQSYREFDFLSPWQREESSNALSVITHEANTSTTKPGGPNE